MAGGKQKVRIGDLLVSRGEITEAQLKQCLEEQKQSGLKLGRILIDNGYIDEDRFLTILSDQLNAPFYDLKAFNLDPEVVAKLPETYARRYKALVLEEVRGEVIVGMVDPMDIFAYDELSRQLGQPISVAVVRETENAIQKAIDEGVVVELSPRPPSVRKLQHRVASRHRVIAESVGSEPKRHLVIYPHAFATIQEDQIV